MDNQNNKDVLLLLPPNTESLREIGDLRFKDNSTPPLNLGNISAILEHEGIQTEVMDYRLKSGGFMDDTLLKDYTKQLIGEYHPRVIGISSVTHTWTKATKIAQEIKRSFPNITVVGGGVHPTFLPDSCLREGFDVIVRREGDETARELFPRLLGKGKEGLEDILGISFVDNHGRITETPDRPLIANLNSLPIIDRTKIHAKQYYHSGAVVSARGCPYNCNFCSCGAMSDHRYRARSSESVLSEVEHILSTIPDLTEVSFLDDTFTINRQRVLEISKGLQKYDLNWSALTRADTLDEEKARAMVEGGCSTLQIGIESGSNKVLEDIAKGITIQDAERAVRIARDVGFSYVICGFMIGHPEDDEETVYETIGFAHDLIRKYRISRAAFSIVTPLPGTELWRNASKTGVTIYGKDDWDSKVFYKANISTKYLTREQIQRLQGIAIASTLQLQKELGYKSR